MSLMILIADDHFPVRFGLKLLVLETLGSSVKIDFAENGEEVIKANEQHLYDILITDINMPQTDGMSMVEKVLQINAALKVLIVSVNPKNIFAPRYNKIGIYGYVHKGASDEELKKAIRCLMLNKRYISDELLSRQQTNSPFDTLSPREFGVMMQLLKGYGIIEIAKTLSLNPSTASTYRSRVLEKLNVKNVLELSNLARKYHITDEDVFLPDFS